MTNPTLADQLLLPKIIGWQEVERQFADLCADYVRKQDRPVPEEVLFDYMHANHPDIMGMLALLDNIREHDAQILAAATPSPPPTEQTATAVPLPVRTGKRLRDPAARAALIEAYWNHLISADTAAARIGITVRQFRRMATRYRDRGVAALDTSKRGRPSNRAIKPHIRQQAIRLVRELYPNYTVPFAHHMLVHHHHMKLSVDALRVWLYAEGLGRHQKPDLAATLSDAPPRPVMRMPRTPLRRAS